LHKLCACTPDAPQYIAHNIPKRIDSTGSQIHSPSSYPSQSNHLQHSKHPHSHSRKRTHPHLHSASSSCARRCRRCAGRCAGRLGSKASGARNFSTCDSSRLGAGAVGVERGRCVDDDGSGAGDAGDGGGFAGVRGRLASWGCSCRSGIRRGHRGR